LRLKEVRSKLRHVQADLLDLEEITKKYTASI